MKARQLILGFSLVWCGVAFADFTLVGGPAPLLSDSKISYTKWQRDVGEDIIGLHRYTAGASHSSPIVLYLPGTNMNSRPTGQTSQHNLLLYLAEQGVPVYGMDYRTAFVPPDFSGDTEFMLDWSFERFVSDANLAFQFVRKQHPDQPIFIAGFSRGAAYAYGLAGMAQPAGLIILDGWFKHYRESEYDKPAALDRLKTSASILSERRGWGNRQDLMQKVIDNPAGPAMKEGFNSIGEQLSQTLYAAWGMGVLANPVEGVSDVQELAKLMIQYDRFFPTRQSIDGAYLAAYEDAPDDPLDDLFGEMKMPIIYFGAEGLGAKNLMNGIYSASESGSEDVSIHVLENHGHLDVLVGNHSAENVFQVIVDWLDRLTGVNGSE